MALGTRFSSTTPGRLYVGRWNERVRAKRCDAVDWGLLKQGDSTYLHSNLVFERNYTKLPSLLCESGTFLLHFCSVAMGKGKFFRDETGLIISHCEWVKICSRWVVRVSFWLMNKDLCKKALFSGIELICEFLRTMLNHNQFLLSIVSYSFYLFVEFAEVLILKGKSDAYK